MLVDCRFEQKAKGKIYKLQAHILVEKGIFMEDILVCRCEEITRREIEEAIENGASTFNEVKRFTRSGMGLCQGRTCRTGIEKILVEKTNQQQKPGTYRQPVRPVNLSIEGETFYE